VDKSDNQSYCFLGNFGGVAACDDPPARVSESLSETVLAARVADEEESRLKREVSAR
jgi:hypothetical protein